jgi:hypothetical protein
MMLFGLAPTALRRWQCRLSVTVITSVLTRLKRPPADQRQDDEHHAFFSS